MYETGFREAVIKFYNNGHTYRDTCKEFNISQATLRSWIKLQAETGSLKSRYHGTSPTIDRAEVKEFVDIHPDAYQREIAEHCGCSQSCISRILKALGYTFKKKTSGTQNKTPTR